MEFILIFSCIFFSELFRVEMRQIHGRLHVWRHLSMIDPKKVKVAVKFFVTSSLFVSITYALIINRRASMRPPDQRHAIDHRQLPETPTETPIFYTLTRTAGSTYVSMCPKSIDGRRLGNQLFNFAAMLHVAKLTGRRVAMPRQATHWHLDHVFDLSFVRVEDIERDLCPCHELHEGRGLAYESSVLTLSSMDWLSNSSLLVCGLTQSWKYTIGVEDELRRHLRPHTHLLVVVRSFFDEVTPANWSRQAVGGFTRVGIHIRAGDVLSHYLAGFTVPRRQFFEQAMRYVVKNATVGRTVEVGLHHRFQFIVVSDDVEWCRRALNLASVADGLRSSAVEVDLVYSVNRTAAVDFVILTRCDVIVMTTGSFGWWAAWLANKTTVYYSNWPRPRSWLTTIFSRQDYFPGHWIPFGGPYFKASH